MTRKPVILPREVGAFSCSKAAEPIAVASALERRALIFAALDPDVLGMSPTSKPVIAILHRWAGYSALLIDSGTRIVPPICLDPEMRTEILTASDIGAEPRLSNALAIWSTRHRHVAVSDQVRVLAHLEDAGEATLIEVARSVL